MGYDLDLIIMALRHLRTKPRYNPVGEIQNAIDWINDHGEQEQKNLIEELKKKEEMEARIRIARQIEQDKIDKQMKEQQSRPALKQTTKSVSLQSNRSQVSQVYAWGNGLQG